MPQIRLIIADEMPPIREYLSMVLGREADLKVIDVVGTGAEAINRTLATLPDILLFDMEMETTRKRFDAIKTITKLAPETRIIVLTLLSDDDVFRAFEVGASDYILKNFTSEKIVETIRRVAHESSQLFTNEKIERFGRNNQDLT